MKNIILYILILFIHFTCIINTLFAQFNHVDFYKNCIGCQKQITEGQQCLGKMKDGLKQGEFRCFYGGYLDEFNPQKQFILDTIYLDNLQLDTMYADYLKKYWFVINKCASITQYKNDTIILEQNFNYLGQIKKFYSKEKGLKIEYQYKKDSSFYVLDTFYYHINKKNDTIINRITFLNQPEKKFSIIYELNGFNYKTEYLDTNYNIIVIDNFQKQINVIQKWTKTSYYKNGNYNEIFNYNYIFDKNGINKSILKNGKYVKYFSNKILNIKGYYIENKKDKLWKYFNESGKLIKTEEYKNGELISTQSN